MTTSTPTNRTIAEQLEEIRRLLEAQDANPFRVASYGKAAETIRHWDRSVADIARDHPDELTELPDIGHKLAGTIEEYVRSGRIPLRDRLEAEVQPEALLQRVPGLGPERAHRVVDECGITTLEELERAAHDGRLEQVEGFGDRRVQAVRDGLAGMLSRSAADRARRRVAPEPAETGEPPVKLLLAVDASYREQAEAGELPTIPPRRFNPEGVAWLPILRETREGWQFTALYSNTQRAHELHASHDWVVIYYRRDGEEDQCTVVTGRYGASKGQRVVRGRETECRRHYQAADAATEPA